MMVWLRSLRPAGWYTVEESPILPNSSEILTCSIHSFVSSTAAAAAVTIAAPPVPKTATLQAHSRIHRIRIAIRHPVRANPHPAIRIKPFFNRNQMKTQILRVTVIKPPPPSEHPKAEEKKPC